MFSRTIQCLSFVPRVRSKCVFQVHFRRCQTEADNPEVVRIRRLKRIFAFGLFGGTLLVGLTAKKHRQRQQQAILGESKRLGVFGKLPVYEYRNFVLAEPVLKVIDKVSAFSFREEDIVVLSFPKTGTTWIQEIVWLLCNNLNVTAAEKDISERFPYLEYPTPGMTTISKQTGQRFIKTHLPPSLLNLSRTSGSKTPTSFPRVVCIVRDPRDVLVSYYYFSRMNNLIGFTGNFNDFFDTFMTNCVPYGPLDEFYSQLTSLAKSAEFGKKVLIVRYEDLKQDFEGQVEKICLFLERDPLTPNEMTLLKNHCSFLSMQDNPSVNYSHWRDLGLSKEGEASFMRKGIIGDWKRHFSQEQIKTFDKIMSSQVVKDLGYH